MIRKGNINWEEFGSHLLWCNIVSHKNEDSEYDIMLTDYPERGIQKGDIANWDICSYVDPFSHKNLTWKELALELGLFEEYLTPDGHDCKICPKRKKCHAYFKDDQDQERCNGWVPFELSNKKDWPQSPKRIGLTGGIGSGKSTVAGDFWSMYNIPCFIADKVAANYYNDEEFLFEIKKIFGEEVFDADGYVDKKKLANIVFTNKEKLEQLNALIHPKVRRDFYTFCKNWSSQPYVIFESAILFNSDFYKIMDANICVYVDDNIRIERTMLRDGCSKEDVEKRIKNQIPNEELISKCDYSIFNIDEATRHREIKNIHNILLDKYKTNKE